MARQVSFAGTTTDATATELLQLDGTRFSIAYNASYRIRCTAIAQNTSTIATKEWSWNGLIKNVAGTVSIVDYTAPTSDDDDASMGTAVLAFAADDTNKALTVTVTGIVATTIDWKVGFDYDSIGYTPTDAVASSSLNVPQLIDMIKLHHPKVPNTLLVKMLSTAQAKFIKATKLNVKASTISMASQTLVGTTSAAPLVLTDGTYSWSFYKDSTVDTIVLKANSEVVFYTGMVCIDSAGEIVNPYSLVFGNDKSIKFMDEYGTALTDFDSDVYYMTIEFVKVPDALSMSAASTPEIQSDYHEALVHHVISDLYMTRTDLQMIERLQASKHFRNLYKEYELKARYEYNMQGNTFPITSIQGEDFRSE